MFEKCAAVPVEEKSQILDTLGDDYNRSNTIALLITLLPNIRHITHHSAELKTMLEKCGGRYPC